MNSEEREELLNEILEQKKKEKELSKYRKGSRPGEPEDRSGPLGMYGWTCPRCGRGLAPHAHHCPCVPMPPPVVTC